MAEQPKLYKLMASADERRERLRNHAVEGLKSVFPIVDGGYELDVIDYEVSKEKFSTNQQKQALLEGRTLVEPVKGTVLLRDQKTGKVLEKSKRTLLHLPYFTERHTFVMGGNDYAVANQVRIKPGVYTRQRENGQLEAQFNLARGQNFRLSMEPEKGIFFMEYGTSKIPLYIALSLMGATDTQMRRTWGSELFQLNRQNAAGKEDRYARMLYQKIVPSWDQDKNPDLDDIKIAVGRSLQLTNMDPKVTKITLGKAYDRVEGPAVLRASQKLLNVYNDKEEADDRDSLAFKTLHTAESFIKERLEKDAKRDVTRKVRRKLRGSGYNQPVIKDILPSAPFTKSIHNFLTTSALSATPMQINPMEVIDSSVKVTSLGEGGISSMLAVPGEARDVHASHLGILDPVRTPESGKAGVDVRATIHMARDDDGNMYAPMRNRRTGKVEYVSATELVQKTIAFPNQKMTGRKLVDVLQGNRVRAVYPSEVDYSVPSVHSLYSPSTNLVPFLESAEGGRNVMGSKFQTQALPLIDREAPLVGVRSWHGGAGQSVERDLGALIAPVSPINGTVERVDGDFVYIRPTGRKTAEDETSPSQPSAVIIKGNPKFVRNNPQAAAFYKKIQTYLEEKGFSVEMNEGLEYTSPPDADLWIGHSRGVDRLRFAPSTTKKLMFGSGSKGAINHPKDVVDMKGLAPDTHPTPNRHHYAFTPEMKRAIDQVFTQVKTAARKKKDDDLVRVPLADNFPLMSKTFVHDEVSVKPGDRVKKDQSLGDNNFTRGGGLALGRNMSVAYMPYYGYNSNDAIVVSEGASQKLTSMHMYKESLTIDPSTVLDKEKHRAYFGSRYQRQQYDKLDNEGVARRGQVLDHGDLIVAALSTQQQSARASMLGQLHKSLVKPYSDVAITWDHEFPGTVIDVAKMGKQVTLTVRTEEPAQVGDKLSNRFGAKGVISKIVPDQQMIQNEAGEPIEMLLTSAGIISRINPNQILETAVAKVAKKTGRPILIDPFSDRDNVKWAKDLLKEHGLKDKETVYDPVSGQKIPNIMVGPQYTFKLFKSTDTNYAARGVGPGYDSNLQPSKGGEQGAKGIGKLVFNSLIAHNARNVLREVSTVKGQRNDEYWRRVQLGLPTATPSANFAYDKFHSMLHGAGIKVTKHGTENTLGPLTDRDIDTMAEGTIKNPRLVKPRMIKGMQQLIPETGGLFDPRATGGLDGNKFSKFNLVEPVVNPVFEEPARRLLEMTTAEFERTRNEKGAGWIKEQLNQLDLKAEETRLLDVARERRGSTRDDAVKRLKYLRALKQENLRPGDAYVLTKIPVVPPKVRPIMPNRDGTTLVSDANYLYRDVALADEAIREMPKVLRTDEEMTKQRSHLHNAVSALFGLSDPVSPQNQGRGVKGHLAQITGTTSPKGGFFQRKLMSRRQDLSGRGTIAPDLTLNIDQVGLPEDQAWTMYEPFLVRKLVQQGYSAVDARGKVKDRHPAARNALDIEVQQRPVMFNRAPTLHRFNMVAAYPKLIPGKTVRINPFVEAGMNADYDGDAVQIHLPVEDAAVREAKSMTLSNLIFGDRSKDDLMVFPAHEALIGTYLATRESSSGPVQKFKTKADAMAAYKRGEITMATRVNIGS